LSAVGSLKGKILLFGVKIRRRYRVSVLLRAVYLGSSKFRACEVCSLNLG
jgi:hypothetical protein